MRASRAAPFIPQDFCDEISEQYAELRDEFYASLEDRKYVSLAEAQKRRMAVDWKDPANAPVRPKVRRVREGKMENQASLHTIHVVVRSARW